MHADWIEARINRALRKVNIATRGIAYCNARLRLKLAPEMRAWIESNRGEAIASRSFAEAELVELTSRRK